MNWADVYPRSVPVLARVISPLYHDVPPRQDAGIARLAAALGK